MDITRKTIVTLFAVLAMATIGFGQEEEHHDTVLQAPDGWGLEVLKFPLGFAREIDYKGFEEIWFSPGWRNVDSQEFWAYAFVWYLDADAEMTSDKLTDNMERYFDGIQQVTTSKANFIQLNDESYVGSIRTFDHFTTKKEFVLNVKMNYEYCAKTNKHTYLFHIAPAPFDESIWNSLEKVKLTENCN